MRAILFSASMNAPCMTSSFYSKMEWNPIPNTRNICFFFLSHFCNGAQRKVVVKLVLYQTCFCYHEAAEMGTWMYQTYDHCPTTSIMPHPKVLWDRISLNNKYKSYFHPLLLKSHSKFVEIWSRFRVDHIFCP